MNTIEAIYSRRAIKRFDNSHQISAEVEDQLLNAAVQSPSSFNIQHWRVVKVTAPDLRQAIRAAAFDQAQVTDASLLYIITADVKAWAKAPQRYWKNAPQAAQDILVNWIEPFYSEKEQLQRDEAMRSVGLFSQTLMLAAKDLGYDSCPMIGFDLEAVAKLINLPSDHLIGMMIAVGKALEPAWSKPGFIEKSEYLIDNKFS